MPRKFKKSVSAKKTVIETTRRYELVVDGWEIYVSKEERDGYRLSVRASWEYDKSSYQRINKSRCHISDMNPSSVTELESFARCIGPLLLKAAEALRAEGVEDMRSDHDRDEDRERETREKRYAS